MDAYVVSHNGLGDNLYMIGALRHLKNFYKSVYFLCKQKNYENVKLFFTNIVCVPFDEKDEYNSISKIIHGVYPDNDIFVCGVHTSYLKSKITNKLFLNHVIVQSPYTIEYDTLTSSNYKFLEGFYKDMRLNLNYFYHSFYLPTTEESIRLYDSIKNYRIIFIQLTSSEGKQLNISNLVKKYIHDKNAILICNDKNLYELKDKTKDTETKRIICQSFVFNKIVHYTETIKNSNEIYIIDSCFVGIVLPYLKTNQLKANPIRILLRTSTEVL